jgi:hypothetical protein
MKRLLATTCLVITLLFRPAAAAADSLTYTGLGSGAWVTLQLGGVTETGWAGEIGWLLKTPTDSVGKAVVTYCADLFDDAKIPTQTVTTTTSAALDAGTITSLNALPNAGAKAAYLVDTYSAGAHGSNDYAAGLQIAVWQSMFGISSFTYSASAGVASAANAYYQGLASTLASNPSAVLSSTAIYFDVANDSAHSMWNANGQDQIDPVVGSPEPPTVLLLFCAVAALGFQRQWSRRRAVAAA